MFKSTQTRNLNQREWWWFWKYPFVIWICFRCIFL